MPAFALVLALLVAACASPSADVPQPEAAAPDSFSDDDLGARAAAAGLSGEQALDLVATGYPILVPVLPDDWELAAFEVDSSYGPAYALRYRRADGACFTLRGAADGLGGPAYPQNQRAVAVDALAAYRAPMLYWVTDDPDDLATWGPGLVTTDYLDADGMWITFVSAEGDGCTALSVDEAEVLVNTLRFLDPADDRTEVYRPLEGETAPTEGVPNEPEALARAQFGAEYTTEGGVTVETLRRTDARTVVLVTNRGLFDDSVRDERIRVVYVNRGEASGGWVLAQASAQVRCYEGRGHTDWSPELCL